jgi:hypothetical protein
MDLSSDTLACSLCILWYIYETNINCRRTDGLNIFVSQRNREEPSHLVDKLLVRSLRNQMSAGVDKKRNSSFDIVHLHPVAHCYFTFTFLSVFPATTKNRQVQKTYHIHYRNTRDTKGRTSMTKRNSNLLKQVLTPEDGQIRPKHVVILKF